ncbi:MAG: diguanylate cyclase [Deltaproteobacteria bacterium]|nr:diguanylate cyclase [Deltaproteobacteria bacterium]
MAHQADPFPEIEAEAERQKTALLYRSAGIAQSVTVVNATLLAAVNASLHASPSAALAWWSLAVAIAAARWVLARRFRAARPDAVAAAAWRRSYVRVTALSAVTWGTGGVLFMWNAPDGARLFSGLVLSGMVAGAVPLLAPVPAAFRAFALLVGVPMSTVVLLQARSPLHWSFGAMGFIFLAAVLASARYLHETLDTAIRLGLEEGRLEEAARRERDFAESLIDTAQAVVLVLDTEGRVVRFNRFFEELSGRRLEEVKGAAWLATFVPERERAEVQELIREVVAGAQVAPGVRAVVARDGREILVEWSSRSLRDAAGRVTGVLAIGQDVTRREELAASQRLLTAAIEQSSSSIMVTDTAGRITFVNAAFTRTTGYSSAEVLGENPRILKSGETPREVYRDLWAALAAGRAWRGELRNRKKSGESYWEEASISPVADARGRISHYLAVKDDITARKAAEEEVARLATTDPLTGVANRRRFLELLGMELDRARRFGDRAALLMLDVDHFKSVNDTHGHAAGDAVLQHLADLSRRSLRRIDLFGRLGGEEFAILLPGTDGAGARLLAERFRHAVADAPAQTGRGAIAVTVSIGIAELDPGDPDPDGVLARADAALYRAKQAGRNRVEIG